MVALTQGHTATAVVLIVWSPVQTCANYDLAEWILGYPGIAMLMRKMMIKHWRLCTLFSCEAPHPSSLTVKYGSHIDIGEHSPTIQS